MIRSENSDPEIKVSLSPESGSLFHFYHAKLAKMNENPDCDRISSVNSNETHADNNTVAKANDSLPLQAQHIQRRGNYPAKKKPQRNRAPAGAKPAPTYIYQYGVQRREKYRSLEMTDHALAEEEAEKHCTKMFHLKDSSNSVHGLWELPSAKTLYCSKPWEIDELLKLKSDLNEVKAQLDPYDIETWHKHTHSCNPAHKISYYVRCHAKPELLTQAFLKFYEILHAFNIVPEEEELPERKFKSLHLCEAPGAFIVALNHFLALQRPNVEWQWLGNTLNPYFEGTPSSECIADDRFILFTLDNWFFGKNETGNLLNSDYFQELLERVGEEKINLVTADGSIDCQRNPSDQEAMTQALQFSEIYSALSTLEIGGSFVLKKFTFFEAESVNMLFLICCCFRDVYVYKPITSKLGNSEVYVVATQFCPPQCLKEYLNTLLKFYGKPMPEKTMFNLDQIPPSFLTQITKCCSFFKTHQVDAIQRNINLYVNKSTKMDEYCDLLKILVLTKFNEFINCSPIENDQKLVPHKLEWDKDITPDNNISKWGGQIMRKSKEQRMKFLNHNSNQLLQRYRLKPPPSTLEAFASSAYSVNTSVLDSLALKDGKSFHFVYVSRFCHLNLVQIYVHYCLESILENEREKFIESSGHVPESELKTYQNVSYKQCFDRKERKSIEEIKSKHPEALIINEGHYSAPHSCHKAFDDFLNLLKEGHIKQGTDVAILNCFLLTRLQTGLLNLIGALFHQVVFYEPFRLFEGLPFIVLKNFTSTEGGIRLITTMRNNGWPNTGLEDRSVNQVLPLKLMIDSVLHRPTCRYNALHSLGNIDTLKTLHE